MNNFNELPEGDYSPDDQRVQLFLKIMNSLAYQKLVSPTDPWDFLYSKDHQSVLAYICWEGVHGHEKRIDVHIDVANNEIEVVIWHDTLIRYVVRYDLDLNPKGVFVR